jgi:hypothetical protein
LLVSVAVAQRSRAAPWAVGAAVKLTSVTGSGLMPSPTVKVAAKSPVVPCSITLLLVELVLPIFSKGAAPFTERYTTKLLAVKPLSSAVR